MKWIDTFYFFQILLAAHIPPGFFERWIGPPFFNADQNDRYVQLIQRYGSVIMTHVYGHTHTDSFRIFGDSDSKCWLLSETDWFLMLMFKSQAKCRA